MAVTVDQFGKALVASGLIAADDVKHVWSELPADARPKDGAAFAKLLVERGILTEYQAAQVLAGRGSALILGEYVVLQEIGAGGMGQVYKAQHKRMKRIVALKVMSTAAMKDEASVKRFQREVEAAARLEHPNVVTAYDAGRAGNVAFLVMQFVDGGDLSSLVKKRGTLEVERAVDYVAQAARGLAYAHSEGVIHRDIKPANLLCDKKGVVKILDMGLARFDKGDDGLTATEQVMGTVDYMSPEQASNTKTADGRSDIYSLGCTLWYLLTGRKMYDGDSMIERLMAHREQPLPSLVKVRDDVPWPLEQAFHKMIAKRAADRYQTMDEVVAALEPFAGGGSRSGAGGMGSSLGMAPGPHDVELSAFLKTVGPAGKSQAKPTPSHTVVPNEATARFMKPEVDTDPKSEVLPPSHPAAGLAPARSGSTRGPAPRLNNKKPPVKWIAAGVGGAAVLIVAAIVMFNRSNEPVASVPGGALVSHTTSVAHAPGSPAPSSTVAAAATPSFAFNSSPPGSTISFLTPDTNTTAPPPPSPGDYALLFDGDGVVEFDDPLPYAVDSFTIEAYVRPDSPVARAVVCSLSERGELGFDHGEGKEWSIRHAQLPSEKSKVGGHYAAGGRMPAEIGKRVHLAGVGSGTRFELFLDGKSIGRTPPMEGRAFTVGRKPPNIGSLFKGVIDEVRISSKARYSADFTPAARHEPDAETLALYHFDEGAGSVLKDASGNHRHGRIVSAKWVKPDGSPIPVTTAGHFALEFDGSEGANDLAMIDSLTVDPTKPLTVEAYVKLATDYQQRGKFPIVGFLSHFALHQSRQTGKPVLSVGHHQDLKFPYFQLEATADPGSERMTHLAAVWHPDKVQLFVDGKLAGEKTEKLPGAGQRFGVFTMGRGFPGKIDEIRVSQTARYDKDFTPQPRFEPDADTLVLYHCDEGSGSLIRDASGNGHHVPFSGAKFVLADAATTPSPIAAP